MKVYSVNVDGEGDDMEAFFATRREAVGFERRHVDSGIECGAVIRHDFPNREALAKFLNDRLGPKHE